MSVAFAFCLPPLTRGSPFRNMDQEAIGIVDRPKMLRFLVALKRPDGSFSLHDRGETDTRGSMAFLQQYSQILISFIQAIALSLSLTCVDWPALLVSLISAASGCPPVKPLRGVLVVNRAVKHMYVVMPYLVLLSCLLFNNILTRFHESLSCFHRGAILTVRLLRYRC